MAVISIVSTRRVRRAFRDDRTLYPQWHWLGQRSRNVEVKKNCVDLHKFFFLYWVTPQLLINNNSWTWLIFKITDMFTARYIKNTKKCISHRQKPYSDALSAGFWWTNVSKAHEWLMTDAPNKLQITNLVTSLKDWLIIYNTVSRSFSSERHVQMQRQ